jgi:hypothetical protein
MNAILRSLVLFTLAALASRALGEGYFNFEVRTHPSMVGRSLNLTDGYDNASNVGSFTLSWGGTASAGEGEAVVTGIILWLGDEDPGREWVFEAGGREARVNHGDLVNASASGGVLTLTFNSPGASTIEFLDAAIYDWDWGAWNPAHGPLALVQNGAFMALPFHEIISGSTVQGQTFELMRGVATGEPSQTFYVVDLSSGRRTPNNATNLAAVEWTADTTTSYPLRPVSFHLNPENWGYRFTLHYQRAGLPEMTQSLVAWPTGSGDSVGFTGSVAAESEFWITRNIDGWDSRARDGQDGLGDPLPGPEHMSVFSPAMALHWENYSFPPPENLQTIEFYVPSGMVPSHVHQPGVDRGLSYTGITDVWEDYDENANPHSFYYDVYAAEVNVAQPFWLMVNGIELSQGEQWHFNGWHPINGPSEPPGDPSAPPDDPSAPPDNPSAPPGDPPSHVTISGTLTLSEGRRYHALRLTAPDGNSLSLDAWSWWGTNQWINFNDPWHGAWGANLGIYQAQIEMTFPGDPANFSGGLTITDETTGEIQGMGQGGADLSQWWLPPGELFLQISLSRWGHDLRLRQRDGGEYSITPGSSQGDLSQLNGTTWYQSYFLFDALSQRRPETVLDWWVHDADTGEESPWNQTDLINWIALMPVEDVSAARSAAGTVALTWQVPGFADPNGLREGGFTIERRANNGAWSPVATGAVASFEDSSNPGAFGWQDAGLATGPTYRYRVAYHYGSPPRRSAWVESVNVAFPPNGDWDGDGMSDAWEIANGFGPDNPNDANGDWDNDGWTNLEEFLAGMNPLQAPQDDPTGANVKLIVFTRLE